jgi:hypothetical protein
MSAGDSHPCGDNAFGQIRRPAMYGPTADRAHTDVAGYRAGQLCAMSNAVMTLLKR